MPQIVAVLEILRRNALGGAAFGTYGALHGVKLDLAAVALGSSRHPSRPDSAPDSALVSFSQEPSGSAWACTASSGRQVGGGEARMR